MAKKFFQLVPKPPGDKEREFQDKLRQLRQLQQRDEGLKPYVAPETPPRSALAQRLAAEYKAKQMLSQVRPGSLPLPDEIGSRPAPVHSLSKFSPQILGSDRAVYSRWLLDQRYPYTKFGKNVVSGIPQA